MPLESVNVELTETLEKGGTLGLGVDLLGKLAVEFLHVAGIVHCALDEHTGERPDGNRLAPYDIYQLCCSGCKRGMVWLWYLTSERVIVFVRQVSVPERL